MRQKLQDLKAKLAYAHKVEKEVYHRIKNGFVEAKDIHGMPLTESAVDFMTLLIAKQIKGDWVSGILKDIVVLGPMDGALTTLSKIQQNLSHLKCPFMPGTIQVSSYHGTEAGRLSFDSKLKVQVAGRDVLIVEDIVDTGKTVYLLRQNLLLRGARSVHIACLIKKDQPRAHPITIRYSGFTIDANSFPVGNMMDYRRMFRDEPDIWMVNRDLLPRKGSKEEIILDSIPKLNEQIYALNRLLATINKFPFFGNRCRGNEENNNQLEACPPTACGRVVVSRL